MVFGKINIGALPFNPMLKKLKNEIEAVDAIIIGAGAGLSTSAGFVYTGERFHKYFSGSGNILQILNRNTVSTICILAASIRIKRPKNAGRIGVDTLKSIGMKIPQFLFMTNSTV